MAPPQRVLGLNRRNRWKIFKSLLLQNHLPQMLEIWFVALPGGLFSSPEHEVLMVSYCDQSMSVVRRLSSTI